jgi:thiol-disulfide isomerase/thioredoxin
VTSEGPRRRLTLYGHSYCGLCETMHAQLLGLAGELGFEIELVDIHDDPALEAHFGERVPVLCGSDGPICHHHLDEPALRRYLSGA